jgi:dTDP-4-dehydrorhamnose reductase
MTAMRILILGGAGMLGHQLVSTLRDEFDVWVTLRGSLGTYDQYGLFDPARTLDGVDVLNGDAVTDVMARVRPDVVINGIGIIKQLAAANDPLLSVAVNSLLPHRLHRLCQAAGARLIHFSTDCVFNGRTGNYTEDHPSDALDLYGRSKFLGETTGPGALTIRSSIIGHELRSRSGLLEWFLSQAGGRVSGYRGAIYSGFTTPEMSRLVMRVLLEYPDLSGTVQISSDRISKYDLLHLVRTAYGIDVEIVPDDSVQIDRSLDSTRFRRLTGYVPPSWSQMIAEMAALRCSTTRPS